MIYLDDQSMDVVRDILKKHLPNRKVLVFGSRVKGNVRPYSDLDLCITGDPLSFERLAQLKEAFSESDLSIRVDIVERDAISSALQDVIKEHAEIIA